MIVILKFLDPSLPYGCIHWEIWKRVHGEMGEELASKGRIDFDVQHNHCRAADAELLHKTAAASHVLMAGGEGATARHQH